MTSATHGLRGKAYQDTWMHLLLLQFGMCAICGRGIGEVYRFVIDHCHKTGEIRGLLCNDCNTKVGIYENKKYTYWDRWSDPEHFANMQAYVAEHRKLARRDDMLSAQERRSVACVDEDDRLYVSCRFGL